MGKVETVKYLLICSELYRAWIPMGGESVVGRLKTVSQPQPIAAKEPVTAVGAI